MAPRALRGRRADHLADFLVAIKEQQQTAGCANDKEALVHKNGSSRAGSVLLIARVTSKLRTQHVHVKVLDSNR